MKQKYSFRDDYSEGAHPRVLKALVRTNYSQEKGYGEDSYCLEAIRVIREQIQNPEADVHFVSAGTQANLIAFAAMLPYSFNSIITTSTSHANIHEAGAIEAIGHKINVVTDPNQEGKLFYPYIQKVLDQHTDEHMVKPKAVCISQATELGMTYKKNELERISEECKKNGLYIYLDGARLGSALTSVGMDMSLPELARLVDMFYIGGTKNGALFGEAIVIVNPDLRENFRYHLKQRGALLAKGRALGVQFAELFRNNLYFRIARYANKMAGELAEGIRVLGYNFLVDSTTNQIFPIFPNKLVEKLEQFYGFYVWERFPEEINVSAIRLVTSWATEKSAIEEFLADLRSLGDK